MNAHGANIYSWAARFHEGVGFPRCNQRPCLMMWSWSSSADPSPISWAPGIDFQVYGASLPCYTITFFWLCPHRLIISKSLITAALNNHPLHSIFQAYQWRWSSHWSLRFFHLNYGSCGFYIVLVFLAIPTINPIVIQRLDPLGSVGLIKIKNK